MSDADFMTVGTAARCLGVSEPTVRAWNRAGRLPALRTVNGYRLFKREDVERVAEQRRRAITRPGELRA